MSPKKTKTNLQFPTLFEQSAPEFRSPNLVKPDTPVPPVTDTESQLGEVNTKKLVAKRIWFCVEYKSGCKGKTPWLGWEQHLNPPTCPNCGNAMTWHQWGARVS